MPQFQVSEASKAKKVPKGMERVTDKAPKNYEVKPSDILIQCLYRPGEAIHPSIIDSSYTWVDQGCGWQRIMDPFNGWIHVARNWQTGLFLKRKEFKYLLILDADEAVPWWIPFHLAEAMERDDLGILSGVVCGFTQERGLFACVAVKGADGRARFPSVKETKTIPDKGIQEVHNAGTGALMIRRDVLEKIWLKYRKDNSFGQPFSIPEKEQNIAAEQGAMPRGEDICFTDRARALGYKVYVDWACKIGHQKPFLLAWPQNMVSGLDPKKWAKLAWPDAKLGVIDSTRKTKMAKKRPKKARKSGKTRGKSGK